MTPLTADLLRTLPLPRHEQGDTKEGRGQVLAVGGSLALPGAIVLGAEAALRAGAGKLQVATCRSIAPFVGVAIPEAMVVGLPETADGGVGEGAEQKLSRLAARADAVLFGPGMEADGDTGAVLGGLLRAAGPDTAFVFDAGALGVLEERLHGRQPGHQVVVTPHAGEMAGLLGVERDAVERDPVPFAREAAGRLDAVVLLKGAVTHVVAPGGEGWAFDGGTVGLGTSGSGDVLAGVIAGLLARGTPAAQAALWGVFTHAEAGTRLTRRYGGVGLLARELPGEIPAIMAGLG